MTLHFPSQTQSLKHQDCGYWLEWGSRNFQNSSVRINHFGSAQRWVVVSFQQLYRFWPILTNCSMPSGSPMASARFSACERTWTEESVESQNGNPQRSKITPSQKTAQLEIKLGLIFGLVGVKEVKPNLQKYPSTLQTLAVCESKIRSNSKVHLQLFHSFSWKTTGKNWSYPGWFVLRSQPSWFSPGFGTRSPSLMRST